MAPTTTKERILAEIWEKALLVLQNVGVNDNFFALGGDSILSIQIISRANQAGLRLSPRHLFEFPTIKGTGRGCWFWQADPGRTGQWSRVKLR